MEFYMSENNSGAGIQQADNRNNEQGSGKENRRQRFDPAKQDAGRNKNRSQNYRKKNNGQRQGGNDNKKRDNAESQPEGKGRERRFDKQNNREKNNKIKREGGQGEKRNQAFNGERKPRNKRPREIDPEVAKTVKKVETIDDIRSDNARITKEIYLEIASLKNINLN